MGKFQKKENEGSMEKKHEEGKESCEEVVEHADEGEIFMVKGVVVGLQTLKQEPPEVSSPTKEGATMLAILLPHFKFPSIVPQKNSLQMSSFLSFNKPSLKVPYHES